jgi:hypothetical protein
MESLSSPADHTATQAPKQNRRWTQPELNAIREATAGFPDRIDLEVVRAQYPILKGRDANALSCMYQRLKPKATKKQRKKWVQEEISAFNLAVARHTRKGLKRDMTSWADVSEDPEFKQYGQDARACECYYNNNKPQSQKNTRTP